MKENDIEINGLNLNATMISLLDLLDDCIYIADKYGIIVFYNRASEELDNLRKDFVIGRHITECFKLDEYSSLILKVIRKKRPFENVYQDYTTVSGNRVTTVSNAYPLLENNELIGVLAVTKNISKFNNLYSIMERNKHEDYKIDDFAPLFTFDQIIGHSKAIMDCKNTALKSANSNASILIYGDTGTGKELLAQSIHNASNNKGSFVSINCAAIPENLLEGILFGTAKGAFTGSIDQSGLFEEASGGTLFLDELNSMGLNLQAKLLRVLETHKIRRVGEVKERSVHPRIISALNISPIRAIKNEILRQDLFYRLGVVSIRIPSLAERMNDIEELIDHFIKKFNHSFIRNVKGVSPEVMELFKRYNWPGNVRELEHTIEYAMTLFGQENEITIECLPCTIFEQLDGEINEEPHYYKDGNNSYRKDYSKKDLKMILEDKEKEIILKCLKDSEGNVSAAAKELGLNRQSLDYKIKKYNVNLNHKTVDK
ncbi:sigma-54 interaction domain-containing protein [Acidaminobacter hydrogenoformans]|uniref:Arginine utilization regulatory protein n=1 Tax=Acidaminobacter hydrogenoformans DSM 2784 TaxID=1120920 RepID=A0A1G5S3P1_9FIRM|nr:sigma 54-interacting transcriptional regulator [Acidaminobacter hydrogenoformans]SCZ80371.1 arginine utilization regulatory protein [Acidaminobacter hydrogenoformans DSM 2784]